MDKRIRKTNSKTDMEVPGATEQETQESKCDTRFPLLRITIGFWCESLQKSYSPGYYRPESEEEYRIVLNFAEEADI